MIIRKYEEKDIRQMIEIWNEVVEDGIAFPQEDLLDKSKRNWIPGITIQCSCREQYPCETFV